MSRRISFWVVWAALCLATMVAAFIFGPFIGPNIVVWIGGWSAMNRISPDGVALAGGVLPGVLAAGVGWRLLSKGFPKSTTVRKVATVIVFILGSLAGAVAYILTATALFVGLFPLCGGAAVVWAIGFCALLALPFLWGSPHREQIA